MVDKTPDPYSLQPDDRDAAPDESPEPEPTAHDGSGPDVEGVPLERDEKDEAPPPAGTKAAGPGAASSVRSLDVCPNCGANMASGVVVCLRCGYDLKSLKVLKTVSGGTVEAPEPEEAEVQPPLCEAGRGDLWLPASVAVVCGLLLAIGYLMGADGLYAATGEAGERAAATPGLGTRLLALIQFVCLVVILAACGLGALGVLARLLERALGDLKLASVRIVGAVTAARLVTLVDIGVRSLEWVVEGLVQMVVFFLLATFLLRLKPRDGLVLTVATVVMFIAVWLGAWLVTWVV
ncbi:MAG: zinc ribbon domain-containing protein [Planctomycetota bacterium]|jgi:hypothetical protein